jgi:nucleotide-binding universal stress UspA family protein
MFKGIKTILFATNLTRNCIPAFDLAVILSIRFKAKIVMLHVMEKMPDYVEGRLEGLLGEDQWKEILHNYENDARQTLIGKRSSTKLIESALEHLWTDAGADDTSGGSLAREVVIEEGDIAECILKTSKEHGCGMIVLGGSEGGFPKKSIGTTVKTVLRKSTIPVVVVPLDPDMKGQVPYVAGWRE